MVERLNKLDTVIAALESQSTSYSDFVGVLSEINDLVESVDKLNGAYQENANLLTATNEELHQAVEQFKDASKTGQTATTEATAKLVNALNGSVERFSSHHNSVTKAAVTDIKSSTELAFSIISKTVLNKLAESQTAAMTAQAQAFEELSQRQAQMESQLHSILRTMNNRVLTVLCLAAITTGLSVLAVIF